MLEMVALEPESTVIYIHHNSQGTTTKSGGCPCLATDPPVILMDEPFSALDPVTKE